MKYQQALGLLRKHGYSMKDSHVMLADVRNGVSAAVRGGRLYYRSDNRFEVLSA